MTLRDKLIAVLGSRGYEQTITELRFIRMVPRTAYSTQDIWLGPNGEVRSGDTLAASVSLDEHVDWSAVADYELAKIGKDGATYAVDAS